MAVDPLEVAQKHFSTAVRGWNREEVREYLVELASAFVPMAQERENLQSANAECQDEVSRLRDRVERLTLELEARQSRRSRAEEQESGTLAEIGSEISAILQAASTAAARIREQAERHAAHIRKKALEEASAIEVLSQALFSEVTMARQKIMTKADRLRYVETELKAAGQGTQREVVRTLGLMTDELERVKGLEEIYGMSPASTQSQRPEVERALVELRERAEIPGWPLPGDVASVPSIFDDEDDDELSLFSATPTLHLASNGSTAADDSAPSVGGNGAGASPAGAQPEAAARGPAGYDREPAFQVAVLGAGYVGLTAATCLAHLGHSVRCTDRLGDRVAQLNRGRPLIVEHGLETLLHEGLAAKKLSFGTDNTQAVGDADIVMLCLPTPEGADGRADLSALRQVAQEIGPHLRPGAIVVDKSTAPVGTSRQVAARLGRDDVAVVSNPEFLREGTALSDFLNPDRVVIGTDDPEAAAKVASMYRSLDAEIQIMGPESAELVKYASNACLATKLSYVNCVADLCEAVHANVDDVVRGMGSDRRIGPLFLEPGPGWGGSCFPKDTEQFLWTSRDAGFPFTLLEEVIASNQMHELRQADRIQALAGGSLEGHTVALWGLTFKAHTDDMRESPAVAIAARLQGRGAKVQAYDPAARVTPPGITVCRSPLEACRGASVLFIATEWEELRRVDLAEVHEVMERPAIFDSRRLLDPQTAQDMGFTYQAVGLSPNRELVASTGEQSERSLHDGRSA